MIKIVLISLLWMVLCVTKAHRLKDEDVAYNKCLTWNANKTKLILQCNVPSLSTYVTFRHEKSKTYVTCNMTTDSLYCDRANTNISKIRRGNALAVILHESTIGKDLSGDWVCQTENFSIKTLVEINKGIISDVWIKIKATTIKNDQAKSKLRIECSSCREPFGPMTEVWINGKTYNNVWLNSNGACILGRNTPCHPDRCNCNGFGNMFQLLFDLPQKGTNISCFMPFEDSYRKRLFNVDVTETFLGSDFTTFNTVPLEMIREQNLPPEYEYEKKTEDIELLSIPVKIIQAVVFVMMTYLIVKVWVLVIIIRKSRTKSDNQLKQRMFVTTRKSLWED